VSLATHGGSLRNRERAQGVTGAGESIDKSGSCTVHRGGEKVGIRMAHGVGAGKMLTEGRRGSARSFLAARRGRGGGEVGCCRELDLGGHGERGSDGLNGSRER
jgi:hypothetical protein